MFEVGQYVYCFADGYPEPNVTWIRSDQTIVSFTSALLVNETSNYTYICRATNAVQGTSYSKTSYEIRPRSGYFNLL